MHPTIQRMKEELQIRGYSPRTIPVYIGHTIAFLSFSKKRIRDLDLEDVRRFMVHLKVKRRLSGSTINQALSAIRFFYIDILGLDWSKKHFRCHKRRHKLPVVLNHYEIKDLFAATESFKHRMVFMTMYSGGLRLGEVSHLKVRDIDSHERRIHIRNGKGQKDRVTVLADQLLHDLRTYWRIYHPREWLFFGTNKSRPLHPRSVQRAFAQAREAAGIRKPATPHSLRHSFATHLLSTGTNIRYIQELLGHKSIQSTLIYLKVSPESTAAVRSPLDLLIY